MKSQLLSRLALFSISVAIGIVAPIGAFATEWTICNRTAQNVNVAIAYSLNDSNGYITHGWWKLSPCGGCKVVYGGDLPVKGVFYRGEGDRGDRWEGNFLYCTGESPFGVNHANTDENTCRSRGQSGLKAYRMEVIKADNWTTSLTDSGGGPRCID
jgi:uncharacterized membrane protein